MHISSQCSLIINQSINHSSNHLFDLFSLRLLWVGCDLRLHSAHCFCKIEMHSLFILFIQPCRYPDSETFGTNRIRSFKTQNHGGKVCWRTGLFVCRFSSDFGPATSTAQEWLVGHCLLTTDTDSHSHSHIHSD